MKRALHVVAVVTLIAAGNPVPGVASEGTQSLPSTADPNVATQLAVTARIPTLRFNNGEIKDILTFIGDAAGVRINYDQNVPNLTKRYSLNLSDVSVEEALTQVLGANGLSFKVVSPTAVFVYADTPENRAKYSVSIQNFHIRYADLERIYGLIAENVLSDLTGIRPIIQVNRDKRTIDVRATADKMAAIAKIIADNDKR